MATNRARTGQLVRLVFEALIKNPEGLTASALVTSVEEALPEKADRNDLYSEVMVGCIAPIKAGWLISRGYNLSVSREGAEAYTRYSDPVEFISVAASRSAKGWISLQFPKSYQLATRAKDRVVSEVKAARRIGVGRLVKKALAKPEPWEAVLPVQAPRRVQLSQSLDTGSLPSTLMNAGHREGAHAFYVPPSSFSTGIFEELSRSYPKGAGLKIAKTSGGVDEGTYIHELSKGDSLIHINLVHSHRQLTLVANLLYLNGIGPRLYDLLEVQCGDELWTAYVVEHVPGGTPTMAACQAGVEKLRELDATGVLKPILPDGFEDEELTCPTCANNAFLDRDGKFKYVDFQNFMLADYGNFLRDVALDAADASHFGDTSVLRGGRYLYQSVPGVDLPAKRSVDARMKVIGPMLAASGVSLSERVVLDIGCNVGMMMVQYLKLTARWCHGWDRPNVAAHTEKLLLALGCTRFSTTATEIARSQPLRADLPPFIGESLSDCAISYLAVRGHLGWLDELATLPWSVMLYEAHEGESREDFERDMAQLRQMVEFEVRSVNEYTDGDSDPRIVAILTRGH